MSRSPYPLTPSISNHGSPRNVGRLVNIHEFWAAWASWVLSHGINDINNLYNIFSETDFPFERYLLYLVSNVTVFANINWWEILTALTIDDDQDRWSHCLFPSSKLCMLARYGFPDNRHKAKLYRYRTAGATVFFSQFQTLYASSIWISGQPA